MASGVCPAAPATRPPLARQRVTPAGPAPINMSEARAARERSRMGRNTPGLDMTAIFSALDRGEDGMVVTVDPDIAGWAERHGYIVRTANQQSGAVYEISPGDDGLDHPPCHSTEPRPGQPLTTGSGSDRQKASHRRSCGEPGEGEVDQQSLVTTHRRGPLPMAWSAHRKSRLGRRSPSMWRRSGFSRGRRAGLDWHAVGATRSSR